MFKVFKGCLMVMKGRIENVLYILQGSIVTRLASVMEEIGDDTS